MATGADHSTLGPARKGDTRDALLTVHGPEITNCGAVSEAQPLRSNRRMDSIIGFFDHWVQDWQAKRSRESDLVAIIGMTTVICVSLLRPVVGIVMLVAGASLYFEYLRRGQRGGEGTRSEEKATLLAGLPGTFTVVSDVALDGYSVDHLVVGPSGVWVVETEWHTGVVAESPQAIQLNGRPLRRDPRRQARASAAEIGRLIEQSVGIRCQVQPIVCFPRATVLTNGSPAETSVVDRQQLSARFRWGFGRLDPDQYTRIASALLALKNGAAGERRSD
jgi:hypothetical protein